MKKLNKYSKKELINIYKTMFLSRKLDKKQLILLKQGKGFFHIGASGHEAVQVAAAHSMDNKIDYAYPYYRNQAFCLAYGMTSKQMLLSFLAKEDDPNSGGRQMPQHFGCKELNIVLQLFLIFDFVKLENFLSIFLKFFFDIRLSLVR